MSFKDYNIQISYKSVGDKTISDVINGLLKDAVSYKRSVGFFSASVFDFISTGIHSLINNDGKIKLITSPKLSKDDIEAIQLGYQTKEKMIYDRFSIEFRESLVALNDQNLKYLAELIVYNVLEIKIVTKKDFGMYHDKVAILKDKQGDKFVFVGSNNETASGYGGNYEKVRVYSSWNDNARVVDEENDFDNIWNGEDDFLDTMEFSEAIKKDVLEVLKERENITSKTNKPKYELYDYQKEAIESWVNNGYKGFYVMATGTGKTVTSIYSLKRLIEIKKVLSVIVVPYKHLVTQWGEDVRDIFGDTVRVVNVSGENPGWDKTIKDYIMMNRLKPDNYKPIIIISTLASYYDDRFMNAIKINTEERLLIVDEAHNFLNKIYDKKFDIDYEYKLGLSATPVFGTDSAKTDVLVNFFGGIVYELPIEKAIGKFLVNYNYYPVFVNATEEDERKFNYQRKVMMGCIDKNGKITDPDKYARAYRAKLRAISMAEEKLEKISEFIDIVKENDHFIIYCSDGRMNDDKKHLIKVVDELNSKGFKPSQFTCEENMKQRESLIDNFNKGYISTLVAIRCLDEGINIPSIKSALILSSNDNYREFVQRRGRILRKYKNKTIANIIDVIVLPSLENKAIAEIEFRRYYEYAKLALNKEQLMNDLEQYMNTYNLTNEDISFKNNYVEDVEIE